MIERGIEIKRGKVSEIEKEREREGKGGRGREMA